MLALKPDRRRRDPGKTPREKPSRGWGWTVVALLALAAGLAFCHGCHRGDHDDEPAVFWFKASPTKDGVAR